MKTKVLLVFCFAALIALGLFSAVYFKPLPAAIEYPNPSRVAVESLPAQSTQMLLELVLSHPLRMVHFGAADVTLPINTRFQMAFGGFEEYKEFILREDCGAVALARYLHTDVLQNTIKTADSAAGLPDNVKYPCALEILEMMVRQPEIRDNFSIAQKIQLAGAQRQRLAEYELYRDDYYFVPYMDYFVPPEK